MVVDVEYSLFFLSKIKSLSNAEKKLIGNFVSSLRNNGFRGLPGKNKPSTGVSKKHVNRIKLIQFAIDNGLHHYHIGYESYLKENKEFGEWTSKYVVHYSKKETRKIKLIDYSKHPPFKLPSSKSLT